MITEIERIIEFLEQNLRFDPQGKHRITCVLENKEVDVLPVIFWKPHNASVQGKRFNMREQFYDQEKMLFAHLEEIADIAHDTFDAQLCIRPNFGTIFIPVILGLKYQVPENDYPWLISHLSKKEIINLKIPNLDNTEMMKRAIDYLDFFKETLPEWIHVYQPDTQGPFDIAHAIYGSNLFIDIYDDPYFVHKLMELSTELYIQVSKRLKKVIGEENDKCYHGHALVRGIYMANGGTRISEDSATLIAPQHIDEFVIPYDQKALQVFKGGFIHYCGYHEYLLESYLKLPEVRAINFGNPEMYDFASTMKKFMDYEKCYFGLWPKNKDENLIEYIERMKYATDGGERGLLLHFPESIFPEYSCQEILNEWRKLLQK
jgi:hypothetical protein